MATVAPSTGEKPWPHEEILRPARRNALPPASASLLVDADHLAGRPERKILILTGQQRQSTMAPQRFPAAVLLQQKMSLDPLNFENQWGEGMITAQLFARLVELSPELDILPDIARDWQVLENGRKYIFHLREDVFWSDGAPLTASDFELSLRRMVSAETGPLYNVSLFCDIRGISAFRQGQAEWHDVGFRALDPRTILIELENPTAYFLDVLTFLAPVPKHRVEILGNSWAEPDKIVTYGAFLLESWEADKSMRLVIMRRCTF